MFRKNPTIVQEITVPRALALQLFDIAAAAGLGVRNVVETDKGQVLLTFAGKQQAYDLTSASCRAIGLVFTGQA